MQRINEINLNIPEGKLLLAAIAKITTESQTDKTPDQVLDQLKELSIKMDPGECKCPKLHAVNRVCTYCGKIVPLSKYANDGQ